MDIFESIETTRAVRRYSDEPVTDDEIRRCIHAAIHGPSGGNIQPWQFLAVTDPATKHAVGDVYRRAYARYEPAVL
jgi:nitroreductase